MGQRSSEHRRHPRAFFGLEEGIPILVRSRLDGARAVRAHLLSLSRGGLSFSVGRARLDGLDEGTALEIEPLELPGFAGAMPGLVAEVRYILDYDLFARLSVGCEFIELDEVTVAAVERYVRERLRELGEDEPGADPLP